MEDAAGWEFPVAPILADCAYGDDTRFRTKLHAQELEYVLAVSAQISVYGPETTFAMPERNGTVGRRRWVAQARSQTPSRWCAGHQAAGARVADVALPRTTPVGEDVSSRFAFVRVVATTPGAQQQSAAARGVADDRVAAARRHPDPTTGSPISPPTQHVSGSPASRGCAGRSARGAGEREREREKKKEEKKRRKKKKRALVTCAHALLTLERLDPKARRPA